VMTLLSSVAIATFTFGYILGEADFNQYFFEGQKVALISERCEHGSCLSLIRLPSGEEIEVSSDRLIMKRLSF